MKNLLPIFADGSHVVTGDSSLNGGFPVCATHAQTFAEREAHAKFIALACNSHDILVEALHDAMFALVRSGANVAGGPNRAEWLKARSALALITPATLEPLSAIHYQTLGRIERQYTPSGAVKSVEQIKRELSATLVALRSIAQQQCVDGISDYERRVNMADIAQKVLLEIAPISE